MISRCCGLTGLGLGQEASPPSLTSHPCQSCTTLLGQPASLRLTPSSLQPAQLLGQGTQATFLAFTLNFLCGLRRLLAFSEPYFLGYKMDTKGSIVVLRTLPKMRPQASSNHPPPREGGELKVKTEGLRGGPAPLLCCLLSGAQAWAINLQILSPWGQKDKS